MKAIGGTAIPQRGAMSLAGDASDRDGQRCDGGIQAKVPNTQEMASFGRENGIVGKR